MPGLSLTLGVHFLDSLSVLPHSNRWSPFYTNWHAPSTTNKLLPAIIISFFYFSSLSGLKTVIGELPPASSSLAANICRRITGRLTNAIAKVSGLKCILYSAFVGSQYCAVALISEY